ncbi:MAG: di-trans,poly-cis-decaprenylcistransferase [Parcubacteria group bacterium]|nr:di-trans,poly-cis-decaprenylcistransferase [Parcubacteria group bacterium]
MPVDNQKINTPTCLGLIMDGNRRWAKAHGLPVFEGHARGYEKLTDLLAWCKEAGIRHVAVYAFSTENWRRTEEEVGYLIQLFRTVLFKETERFKKENGRVKFIGQKERFDKDIQEGMEKMEKETSGGEYTLYVCISYGGRAEILTAIQKIAKEKTPEEIQALTEDEFGKLLWTDDMPEPDIVVRTGGEKRLSNFLTWQSVYSELFFTDTLWPEFSKEEFTGILEEYAGRERRRGK